MLDSKLDLAMQVAKVGLGESPIKNDTKVALHEKIANTYFRMKKYSEALEAVKICLELNPDDILQTRLKALQDQIIEAQK